MSFPYIPKELVNIILEFDGQIKYRRGEYINIIHKQDTRYNIIEPVIKKKKKILKTTEFCNKGFYFEVCFEIDNRIGFCYDYNFSWHDTFEICYFDIRNSWKWEQIRTVL